LRAIFPQSIWLPGSRRIPSSGKVVKWELYNREGARLEEPTC
jgi:hypothetical protein